MGVIAGFIEIARGDVNKATRVIYVYLSDNWFINEEAEFTGAQWNVGIHITTMEELRKYKLFWTSIFAYLKKFAPEAAVKVDSLVAEYANIARAQILKNITGGKAEQYDNDLRQFIYQRMEPIGIYKKQPNLILRFSK